MAATTTGMINARPASLLTTNGNDKVSVTARDTFGTVVAVLVFDPEQAVDFAIALLGHAQNVRDGLHDNSGETPTPDRARAHRSLTWEPPVSVSGELITRLAKSYSQTESDRKTAISMILKEAGRR